MIKQSTVDTLYRCLEHANKRNNDMIACGFRVGHRISVTKVPLFGMIEGHYTFKCLDCGMSYETYKDFTPREQELIDNLKKGARNEE